MGLSSILFGCKQHPLQKDDLIGNWEAVKLNSEPINKDGFASITMRITPDSIHIKTVMKTNGSITTESVGTWELKNRIFISKIGENFRESELEFLGGNLKFSPDPLFKEDAVFRSEYTKTK